MESESSSSSSPPTEYQLARLSVESNLPSEVQLATYIESNFPIDQNQPTPSTECGFPAENQPDQLSGAPDITPAHEPNPDDISWLGSIANDFQRYRMVNPEQLPHKYSIPVVPPDISQFDPEVYKPKVVSIGPYHYKNLPLADNDSHPYRDMQLFKWHCVHHFMSGRSGDLPNEDQVNLLNQCALMMKSHDARIRSCYSKDKSRVTNEELATIMMLDGCFILHLLIYPDCNTVAGRIWIWTLVRDDLLLLENQIPFFVLYELLYFFKIDEDLMKKALNFFGDTYPRPAKSFSPLEKDQIHHLFHLFYLSLLPIKPSNVSSSATQVWIPRATELTNFGIKFHKKDKAESFLDVNFTKKGRMEIPPLLIDDHSKILFRNLIAFEQCSPGTGCYISVYASFMDCIINSEQDVRLLHLKGILINRMDADQDITRFFSSLCKGVHIARDGFYLANLFRDVMEYKDDTFNKCFAEFKRR